VIGDLGVASGMLVALIGVGLLVTALRRRSPRHDDHDHSHGHGHHHHEHGRPRRTGRTGLVGMGVAGGLVPSPSALVVLLGAIALGRTLFGVLLVLTYGLGMAATLTGAGLLAVRLSNRWRPQAARLRIARRLTAATPLVTGGLVVVVGLGLAARSLAVL
jgi:ABC-type nickel/cobalt efflux system permease component RcnA